MFSRFVNRYPCTLNHAFHPCPLHPCIHDHCRMQTDVTKSHFNCLTIFQIDQSKETIKVTPHPLNNVEKRKNLIQTMLAVHQTNHTQLMPAQGEGLGESKHNLYHIKVSAETRRCFVKKNLRNRLAQLMFTFPLL